MNTFKDDLYRDYAATHLLPRKGPPSVAQFASAAGSWRMQFSGLLPDDPRAPILDLGCGSGKLVWWFQHDGYVAAEGVDLNAELIATGRALGVRDLHQDDARRFLEARPDRYALIVLRDVLEHFTRDEVMALLALVRAALAPGGRIVIQAPNGESPFFGRIRYGDFTHELAFAPSSAQQVLLAAGFAEVEVRPCPPTLVGVRSWPRRMAWWLVSGGYRFMLWAETGRRDAIVTQNLIATARRPAAAR